jgi:glycosyltransferase involved in cell wall biosynthesis
MANQKHRRLIEPELSPMGKENVSVKLAVPVQENGGLPDSSRNMNFSHFQRRPGQVQNLDLTERKDLSVVIPLFNEEESVESLYESLLPVLVNLEKTYEIIYIDDGSIDGTYPALLKLMEQDPHIWIIRLRRNFGQTAAFSAGFDLARGDIIVTMDGDLQNDPNDIPRLIEKVEEGYDVVSGWRVDRKDVFLTRRLPSQIANALISKVTGVKLHDYGCSLKAYRREVVKNIKLYGEMHRFIPALASWIGIVVAEVPVTHHARKYGQSKYGLGRTVKVILDLLTVKFLLDYATRPIQIFGLMGLLSFIAGTLLGIYLTVVRLFFGQPLANRPIVLLAVLLVVLGVQLIIMGLLGELVVRTYHEAQGKPIYMIRDVTEAVHSQGVADE